VKNFTVAVLMASLALPLGLGASAQTRQTPPSQSAPARETWQHPQGAVESGELIGARIKNAEGKDLGDIDGLLVNESDGKVTHIIVGWGGIAGIGETKVVVPWSQVKLRRDREGSTPVVSMDESTLQRAPRYERRQASGDRSTPPAASPKTGPSTSGTEGSKKQ
jgi:sporulation protein YlmC with PRC-barrel domain